MGNLLQSRQGTKGALWAKAISNFGYQLIMNNQQAQGALCRGSSTLHLLAPLGLESSLRPHVGTDHVVAPSNIGLVVGTTVAISVPRIPIYLDSKTGITRQEIGARQVPSGGKIALSFYEFMFLIIRPEYSGLFTFQGKEKSAYFSPKLPSFFTGENMLPTPTFNIKNGSLSDHIHPIDKKVGNNWVIKDEFKDPFEGVLSYDALRQARRKLGKAPAMNSQWADYLNNLNYVEVPDSLKSKFPAPVAISVALNHILSQSLPASR